VKNKEVFYFFKVKNKIQGYPALSLVLGMFGIKYPYKYIHQEYVLPLNKELLVLGNVVKREDGTYHIVPPKSGISGGLKGVIGLKA
jgi:hypothetical protein